MDYLDKGEMFTNRNVNKFVLEKFERNKLFVSTLHLWDLLFQLMKHGTYNLHDAFIFLFSVNTFS
jgi:hypothetical protein